MNVIDIIEFIENDIDSNLQFVIRIERSNHTLFRVPTVAADMTDGFSLFERSLL
jgi:hypothetical protein